jgi:ribonuclease HII
MKKGINEFELNKNIKNKIKIPSTQQVLKKYYNKDEVYEIGVDEVGRGPLFGRVYTAAVILPKDDSFDYSKIKDSKKFHSKKKIEEVSNYIKTNALAWYISYENENKIDEINILQATQLSMHNSIYEIIKLLNLKENKRENIYNLLIDGNYFNPLSIIDKDTDKSVIIPYKTIINGDNTYACIAAASILAKVERDNYINELCIENPFLEINYGINSNKGYGTKKHIDGIKKNGITIWHRKSFGICKKM